MFAIVLFCVVFWGKVPGCLDSSLEICQSRLESRSPAERHATRKHADRQLFSIGQREGSNEKSASVPRGTVGSESCDEPLAWLKEYEVSIGLTVSSSLDARYS